MARIRHRQHDDGWTLLCCFSAVMFVLVFLKLDVVRILRIVLLCLLGLGSVTLFLYLVGDKLEILWRYFFRRRGHGSRGSEFSAAERANEQREAREKIQIEYQKKAAKYEEDVVRPREEAKKAKLEGEFYKFAGPAWKGKSQRLGDGKEPNIDEDNKTNLVKPLPRRRVQGTSKDASAARKLPESVTRPRPVVPDQAKPERRVVTLPDEPDTNDKLCLTIAMRGLQSTIRKRRFLCTEKVQVLLDWMTKLGYHPQLYTVCSTFPWRDLSEHIDKTLEEIELSRDVMLVIEERL